MIQIGDVVVSFDVLREKFLCDLDACQGICCIEDFRAASSDMSRRGTYFYDRYVKDFGFVTTGDRRVHRNRDQYDPS
jgi:hypothetical protein